ncbi:MAG: DUF3592 domain-containing protein [Pirellulales bacterium]|nr:DUF3592 domain-containing protein [Pirellulales bacterium]
MSRSLRVYEKKRGHRRTGSRRLGSFGEMVFFGLFFLGGCIGLAVVLGALVIPEWRVNHEFVEIPCVVRGKELGKKQGEDGPTYRPEIQIEYRVDDRTHVTKTYDICGVYSGDRDANQAILDRFQIGGEYPCWYDPANPNTAVLVRGYTWWMWLILFVPVTFLLIGGIGLMYRLLHWGKSAEHRAAAGKGALSLDRLTGGSAEAPEYPSIPLCTDQTDSPGTRLKYRLAISASPVWQVVGLLVGSLFWNGIVAVFVVPLARDHMAGNPNWLATAFLVPFVLVGVVLVFLFFRQLLVTTGVGPTWIEISDHPLRPGRSYEVLLSQAGRLRMNRVVLRLVCQEQVRYRQGTDTRTETQCVFRRDVFRRDDFEIQPAAPLEAPCSLEIPVGVMHSFAAGNNEVKWSLAVEGDVAAWPNFSRSFPLIVRPADDAEGDQA